MVTLDVKIWYGDDRGSGVTVIHGASEEAILARYTEYFGDDAGFEDGLPGTITFPGQAPANSGELMVECGGPYEVFAGPTAFWVRPVGSTEEPPAGFELAIPSDGWGVMFLYA